MKSTLYVLIPIELVFVMASSPADIQKGINFGWFNLSGCGRNQYYVFQHPGDNDILQELKSLRTDGYRFIRLPLYFDKNGDIGILSDRNGLNPEDRNNIIRLVDIARASGFNKIIVGFFPLADSFAGNWASWNEETYLKNRDFLFQVIMSIVSKGDILIDLGNEHIPEKNQPMLLEYVIRLLRESKEAFPKAAFTFSAIPSPGRIANLDKIFSRLPPEFVDFHIYDNVEQALSSIGSSVFVRTHRETPLLVGETYADTYARLHIVAASKIPVVAVLHWPLSTKRKCKDVDIVFGRNNK